MTHARRQFSIAILLAAVSPAWARAADRPLNIVFILADDMGWTDAGCYGSDLYETPNIDRLAAEGMKFTNSYAACHVCSPTRASIMTGKYPARLHLTDYIPGKDVKKKLKIPKWQKSLLLEEVTIAEVLKEAGYATGHFGKWHLNKDKNYRLGRPMDPGSQGFDVVLTTHKPKSHDSPTKDPHHVTQITDAAIRFIEKEKNAPFFCYVSHNTLHRPIIGHPDLIRRYEKKKQPDMHHRNATYAAMVHDLDQSVGRILSKIVDLNIADRTLVIFTSDNGGFLGDKKDRGTSGYPLRGGKGTNFEGGVRVPTIVRWPGVVTAGAVCDQPIISTDFFPTLLAATKVESNAPPVGKIDGINIVPLLKDPTAPLGRDALYWHYPHYHSLGATPHGAIRVGDWKLIEFFEDMHVELYNLGRDIGEQHDQAAQMPKKVADLRNRLHRWRTEVDAQMPTRNK